MTKPAAAMAAVTSVRDRRQNVRSYKPVRLGHVSGDLLDREVVLLAVELPVHRGVMGGEHYDTIARAMIKTCG